MKKIHVVLLVCLLPLTSISQNINQSSTGRIAPVGIIRNLSDGALLDVVQRQTFRYFWDFAHPVSGLARERSNANYNNGNNVVTTGGTGFGIMGLIVAVNRKWITREQGLDQLLKTIKFLEKADTFHGVFPHWLNGETGKVIPFSSKDDGADIAETAYLFEGLLCARQYFNGYSDRETELRERINKLWNGIEWNWFTRGGQDIIYWHWSPNNSWAMDFPIRGFNECMIVYVMAVSGNKYTVPASAYHQGWAQSSFFKNNNSYYGHKLPLGFPYGGPLFFSQYTFLALNPKGLKDRYADYWEQNRNHTLINHDYCVDNPKKFKGYGTDCWGLTASDNYEGYNAHSPTNDLGVITPTAALSAFPYTPEYSMKALRHFYYGLGEKIWGEYGFVDAFSEQHNWYAKSYLAIDQGPIIGMIENYRTGLLWKLFMSCPEIQQGLKKLNFEISPIK